MLFFQVIIIVIDNSFMLLDRMFLEKIILNIKKITSKYLNEISYKFSPNFKHKKS